MLKVSSVFLAVMLFSSGYLVSGFIHQDGKGQSQYVATDTSYLRSQIATLEAQNKQLRINNSSNRSSGFSVRDEFQKVGSGDKPPERKEESPQLSNCVNQDYVNELLEFKAKVQTERIVGLQGELQKKAKNGVSSFERNFSEQPVDSRWASVQEENLQSALSGEMAANTFSIVENQCKQSLCRVALITPNETASQSVTSVLNQALYSDKEKFQYGSYYAERDANSGLTYVYIARDEQNFQSAISEH